ncbi:MAG: hypothetical protein R3F59_37390 [Myxococcota bacterium]
MHSECLAPDGDPLVAVTFNTGTTAGLDHDAPPDDGYGDAQAATSDAWYGDGLAWQAAIDDATDWFAALQPDLVAFQEVYDPTTRRAPRSRPRRALASSARPGWRAIPRSRSRCSARTTRWPATPTTPTSASACAARSPRSAARCRAPPSTAAGAARGSRGPSSSSRTAGSSPSSPSTAPPASPPTTRTAALARSTRCSSTFQWITEVGPDAPLTYGGVATIDHVASDAFTGTCWHAGLTEGHPAVRDAVYFDHRPAVCTLAP